MKIINTFPYKTEEEKMEWLRKKAIEWSKIQRRKAVEKRT